MKWKLKIMFVSRWQRKPYKNGWFMMENNDFLKKLVQCHTKDAGCFKNWVKLCCFTDLIILLLYCQGYNVKLLSLQSLPKAYSTECHGQNKIWGSYQEGSQSLLGVRLGISPWVVSSCSVQQLFCFSFIPPSVHFPLHLLTLLLLLVV